MCLSLCGEQLTVEMFLYHHHHRLSIHYVEHWVQSLKWNDYPGIKCVMFHKKLIMCFIKIDNVFLLLVYITLLSKITLLLQYASLIIGETAY